MPRLKCPSCRFTITVTRREAEFGMRCPQCHCGRLIEERKERPGKRVVTLRSGTLRALIGGVISIIIGPLLLCLGFYKDLK